VSHGFWLLKPEISQSQNQHNELIASLAEIGRSRGYRIWVGLPEQTKTVGGLGKTKKLKDYVNVNVATFQGITDITSLQNIDLLWVSRASTNVIASFEIEATTPLTEALRRGSTLPDEVRKYMLLPRERQQSLRKRLQSPLFAGEFARASWHVLFFDQIQSKFRELKTGKLDMDKLASEALLRLATAHRRPASSPQASLFPTPLE